MGPFGYEMKYHQYPHSVVFELLCETGLVGTIFLLALIVYALVRVLQYSKKHKKVADLLIFLLVYAVLANINDSLWACSPLMFALGYGLSVSTEE